MSNGSNRAARSPSIPIPSSRRNFEEILNSASTTVAASTSPQHERALSRSATSTRSLFTGLEGSRPPPVRGTTSTSVTREPVSGGPSSWSQWGTRAVSSSVPSWSAGPSQTISGFEPRVIRGNLEEAPAPDILSSGVQHVTTRRPSPSLSPSRNRRPSVNSTRNIATPPRPTLAISPQTLPPSTVPQPSVAFLKPSYLKHSALRGLLYTDMPPALPPSRYGNDATTTQPTSYLHVGQPMKREVTPFTDSDEESESSMVRGYHRPSDRGRGRDRPRAETGSVWYTNKPVLRLPTRWSEQDRSTSLNISPDGREIHFPGPTGADKEAVAVRANYPIPPACGVYYYEVEILSKGQKGHISVGFSSGQVRLSRLPGWEKDSWGYHGDDGNKFASDKTGKPFGPRYTAGDVVGCGVDFSTYRAFFTKNGTFLGTVFEDVGKECPVFPSVGLCTAGESVRVNFGQEPFKFDVDCHVHSIREHTWAKIQSTAVKCDIDDGNNIFTLQVDQAKRAHILSSAEGETQADDTPKAEADGNSPENFDDFVPISPPVDFQTPINKLILSYLTHHGYERSARALKTQVDLRNTLAHDGVETPTSGPFRPKSALASALHSLPSDRDLNVKMMETDLQPADTDSSPSTLDDGLDGAGVDYSCEEDVHSRQRIVTAIVSGDIDTALRETQERHPSVLEKGGGLILFKLRCRKFVELMLESTAALKRMNTVQIPSCSTASENTSADGLEVAMEIDDPPVHTNGAVKSGSKPSQSLPREGIHRSMGIPQTHDYQAALNKAIAYGKDLHADYRRDTRPEVQSLFRRTCSLVAYENPSEATGDVADLVSQGARAKLAQEVNQAILESQGRPSQPALERIYRQTAATIMQLGLMGVGAAVFADMRKEFLD